jgi:UDP-N-acetylglucosamine--N-acetylmuramyl-(pentapeptide) pyrophosphoryl-undecaprenol N-acetylglucosamine transferase
MRVIISGGGTGGHLFPGIALAEEFQSRSAPVGITFVGTKKGIEQRTLPGLGYELKTISGAALLGEGALRKLTGLIQLMIGVIQASGLIRELKPDLVIGTGGYASAPVLLAAWLWGITTAICEQNSVPGLTNRLLGRVVRHVFVAFEESYDFFPQHKTSLSGNPVRKTFLKDLGKEQERSARFCLFIVGGSQGAQHINRAMIEALEALMPHKERMEIIHQTGSDDFTRVRKAYETKQLKATVAPFITDMVSAYRRAHLVISRAGALTLTELSICGRPSVLIPYPHAAYNHQEINARVLVDRGAAQLILDKELTGAALGETIVHYLHHPEELAEMGSKALALARPEAAKTIVDTCYHLSEKGGSHL